MKCLRKIEERRTIKLEIRALTWKIESLQTEYELNVGEKTKGLTYEIKALTKKDENAREDCNKLGKLIQLY